MLKALREYFTGLLWVSSDAGLYNERGRLVLTLRDQGISTDTVARMAGVTFHCALQIVQEAGT